jgi:hypothetical protein
MKAGDKVKNGHGEKFEVLEVIGNMVYVAACFNNIYHKTKVTLVK